MRDTLRLMAEETIEILDGGRYQTPSGRSVSLADDIARAVAGTRLYPPGELLPAAPEQAAPEQAAHEQAGHLPVIEVTDETTLAAARQLGGDVAALVFASATKPGGGFRNGAVAQEESLARASALYSCQLSAGEFYQFHRRRSDPAYSDHVIYSPAVPVFRDDGGTLLERPYLVSFLTAAAPNLTEIEARRQHAADVPRILRARAARVLEVAAAHGHRRIVLGAWGCGVFGNDPAVVAEIFSGLLAGSRWFERVRFAVYDRLPGAPIHATFARILVRGAKRR
jgi:uncharacterized protein (TIGR02452 family)